MLNSKNLYTVASITAALIIGFVIGISINFPKVNNSDVSGTIGKVDNYHNVKVTEADIQLRSELLSDTTQKKGYINYYAFHYSIAAELSAIIDSALAKPAQLADFNNQNPSLIDGLKSYRKYIETPRTELFIALTMLNNIDSMKAAAISQVLNNANIAIAKMSYNENIITNFVEVANNYILKNKNKEGKNVLTLHDKFSMLLFTKAVVTNNKPMLKYYDKKELFSDTKTLNVVNSTTLINACMKDSKLLKTTFQNQNSLGAALDQANINNIQSSVSDLMKEIQKLNVATEGNLLNSEKFLSNSNNVILGIILE